MIYSDCMYFGWVDLEMFVEGRGSLFFFMLFFFAVYYVVATLAKQGKKWDLRRLPQLDAIVEGIGRAVELGRPVHFSAGVARGGPGDPDRLHAYPMLRYIARECAQRDCRLITTVGRSEVYAVLDQIVREAAITAGKPEWYRAEDVQYLGDEQFVYVGGVMGLLIREKVATNLLFGYWRGSLINALEAGRLAGCLQIGGIGRMSGELGIMALGCDYWLILEELIAASAYLSEDPEQIGTVAAQDYVKFTIMAISIIGALLFTAGIDSLYKILHG